MQLLHCSHFFRMQLIYKVQLNRFASVLAMEGPVWRLCHVGLPTLMTLSEVLSDTTEYATSACILGTAWYDLNCLTLLCRFCFW